MSSGIVFLLGGAAGFCVGYVVKKVADYGAGGVGSCLLVLLLLSLASGFGSEWPLLKLWLHHGQQPLDPSWQGSALFSILYASVPALAGAVPGFILGLRIG